ncbi:hypothetical protein ACPCAC_09655 [Streptomyces lavendulocolor]|uniref:hypothetical protein n=1 Tax=Streptomyces lavendulocolor TaxID=67316 RepID=UPI003C2B0276
MCAVLLPVVGFWGLLLAWLGPEYLVSRWAWDSQGNGAYLLTLAGGLVWALTLFLIRRTRVPERMVRRITLSLVRTGWGAGGAGGPVVVPGLGPPPGEDDAVPLPDDPALAARAAGLWHAKHRLSQFEVPVYGAIALINFVKGYQEFRVGENWEVSPPLLIFFLVSVGIAAVLGSCHFFLDRRLDAIWRRHLTLTMTATGGDTATLRRRHALERWRNRSCYIFVATFAFVIFAHWVERAIEDLTGPSNLVNLFVIGLPFVVLFLSFPTAFFLQWRLLQLDARIAAQSHHNERGR